MGGSTQMVRNDDAHLRGLGYAAMQRSVAQLPRRSLPSLSSDEPQISGGFHSAISIKYLTYQWFDMSNVAAFLQHPWENRRSCIVIAAHFD
jgi:hypothetical protein